MEIVESRIVAYVTNYEEELHIGIKNYILPQRNPATRS